MKKFLTLSILLVLILLFVFNKKLIKKKSNKEIIYVGIMNGWYPFANLNKDNDLEGFDIDVIKEIEKIINKKIIIKDLGSLSSLFISLKKNKIDAVFSGLDITETRKNDYLMINYTGKESTSVSFVFLKDKIIDENILKYEKLLFSCESSSSLEPIGNYFYEKNKNFSFDKSSSLTEMILKLKYKKVDFLILENNVASNLIKENKDLFNLIKVNLPKDLCIDGCGIAMMKKSKYKDEFLNAIKILKENETIQNLEKKWKIS